VAATRTYNTAVRQALGTYDQLARNWGNFTKDSAGDSDYRAADVVIMKLQWFDERGIPEVMFGLVEDPNSPFAAECARCSASSAQPSP
jgi:hypothetical protein